MDVNILKKNYNKVLAREKDAEKYFENNKGPETEKYLVNFEKLIVELSMMMKRYKELTGIEMTKEEILEGFKV